MSLLAEINNNKQQHSKFKVYGHGNNWKVVNYITDETVDRFTSEEDAYALADKLQSEDNKKQSDFYKTSRGMMMGDVEMDHRSEEEETSEERLKSIFKSKSPDEPEVVPFLQAMGFED